VSAAEATLGYRLRQYHVGLVCWAGNATGAAGGPWGPATRLSRHHVLGCDPGQRRAARINLLPALEIIAGYSPVVAGSALVPVTVVTLLLSGASGRLAQRIGPRPQIVAGCLLRAVASTLAVRVGPHVGYWTVILPVALLFGLGLASLLPPLTASAMNSAPDSLAGVASGVNNAVARIAGLLWIAALPAEALNNLGQLASRTSAAQQAREHHSQAMAIARDLGVPLEEARALEGLAQSHLQDGHTAEGAPYLRQALTIYQRIGTPDARRIQQAFRHDDLIPITPEAEPAAVGGEDLDCPRSRNARPGPRQYRQCARVGVVTGRGRRGSRSLALSASSGRPRTCDGRSG